MTTVAVGAGDPEQDALYDEAVQDRHQRAQAVDFLRAAAAEDRLQPRRAHARGDGDWRASSVRCSPTAAAKCWRRPQLGLMSQQMFSLVAWRVWRGAWRGHVACRAARCSPLRQPGTTALDRYLDGLNSLRTAFTQTVTDARGHETEAGSGTLMVQRPGRFRWDYQPRAREPGADGAAVPAERAGAAATAAQRGQLLVADGKNLWFYDRELAQVTVKPVDCGAVGHAGRCCCRAAPHSCTTASTSAPAGPHDGLDWVQRQAAQRGGGFQSR